MSKQLVMISRCATFDDGNGAINYNDAQLSRDGTRLCILSRYVDSDKGFMKGMDHFEFK